MTISQERLREIASIPDEEIDIKDIPELDADFWENATLCFKSKPINELTPQEKEEFMKYRDCMMVQSLGLDQETLPVDEDTTAEFKTQGTDHYARINAVLRDYIEVLPQHCTILRFQVEKPDSKGILNTLPEAQTEGLEGNDAWFRSVPASMSKRQNRKLPPKETVWQNQRDLWSMIENFRPIVHH